MAAYHLRVSRPCPMCNSAESTSAGAMAASRIIDSNPTYRPDAASLLGVEPSSLHGFSRCTACGFLFASQVPASAFLARLYSEVIDPRLVASRTGAASWTGHQLRLAGGLLQRLDANPLRILDYGCGDGVVVRALRAAGIECFGYEPFMRGKEESIFDSLRAVEAAVPFEAILLSDVLEHVPDPRQLLIEVRGLLAPRGLLCVSVPDFREDRARRLLDDAARGNAVSAELNPWEHLNYFSPESLSSLLERSGFVPEREPVPAFGLRDERGSHRILNAVSSISRMIRHVIDPRAGTTTIYAWKSAAP